FHRFLAELLGAMRHALVDQGARVRRARIGFGSSLHALFQIVDGEWLHARSLAPLPAAGERPYAYIVCRSKSCLDGRIDGLIGWRSPKRTSTATPFLAKRFVARSSMAPATLDFRFEFSSTYSYPATMRIGALAAHAGVGVRLRPFLLGPIFLAQGWNT